MLHTPDIEATKFWVGNLGKTATHGIVYAQLIMQDGSNMGTHARFCALESAPDPPTDSP